MLDPQVETDGVISLLRDELVRARDTLQDAQTYFVDHEPIARRIDIRLYALIRCCVTSIFGVSTGHVPGR